jgi:hypothetical protein
MGGTNRQAWEAILIPLRLLRNIDHFSIRYANLFEIPKSILTARPRVSQSCQPVEKKALEAKYRTLIQGNTPVEITEQKYRPLLAYSQSFELHKLFLEDMASDNVDRSPGSGSCYGGSNLIYTTRT